MLPKIPIDLTNVIAHHFRLILFSFVGPFMVLTHAAPNRIVVTGRDKKTQCCGLHKLQNDILIYWSFVIYCCFQRRFRPCYPFYLESEGVVWWRVVDLNWWTLAFVHCSCCQLQHRSSKQRQLAGQACDNKHTLRNSHFSNSCSLVFMSTAVE